MKASLALVAVLAPLAGAFAAAGGDRPADEGAAARAWIAQARRQAKPVVPEPAPGAVGPPVPADEPPPEEEALADPFGLARHPSTAARQASQRAAQRDEDDDDGQADAAKPAQAPSIRVLGTLLQAGAACAVLTIDGASYRVRVGDTLPSRLGRVLKISEDAVEISGGGTPRLLTLDSAQAQAAPAASPDAALPRSQRAGRRRLISPGVRG